MTKPSLRTRIHDIIFEADTRAGKAFDIALLFAIILSIAVVMLESVKSLDLRYGREFTIIEWGFTILFTIEYFLRIYSIKTPYKYIFSFYGIIDLLSIIPTYVSLFIGGAESLLVIRSLRLLRVFRVLKLSRYVGASNHLFESLYASRRKILVFLFAVLAITIVMGTLMYMVEGGKNGFNSIPKSIYWAIVTLTTVGYGDISPQTWAGQLLASIIMILGYGIIAVPTGIVTSEMAKPKEPLKLHSCNKCGHDNHEKEAQYCSKCGNQL